MTKDIAVQALFGETMLNRECCLSLRALTDCRELFVLAGTVGLMCSAEVFALCHPHLLFGKRSQ